MTTSTKARPLFDPPLVRQALLGALRKLDPRIQIRNPVMFVVFVGSLFTSLLFLQALFGRGEAPTKQGAAMLAAKEALARLGEE